MGKCDNLKDIPKEICQFVEETFEPEVEKWLGAYITFNEDEDGRREIADEVKKLDERLHRYFSDLRIEPKTLLMLVKGMLGNLENLAKTDDLKNLVKKEDLGVEKESVDLKELAKKSDLNGLGGAPVDLSGIDTKIKDLDVKVSSIKTETAKIEDIKTETGKIKDLVKKEDLGIKGKEKLDLKDLVRKEDLGGLTKEVKGIKDATDKIKDIKTETDKIKDLAKTTDLPDISNLAKKDDIPDLSNLAKKDDIPDLSNLAQKNDLKELAKTADLKDLVKKSDLGVDLKELAKKSDLKNLVEKKDLGVETESVNLKELAKKSDLNGLGGAPVDLSGIDTKIKDLDVKVSSIKTETAKIEDIKTETGKIKDLVKKEDLGIKGKEKLDLKDLVRKEDLGGLTKEVKGIKDATDKIKDIKTETDKIKDLAKTTDLPDISNLAKKDDIPDLSNLAQKNDLKELAKTADLKDLVKKSDLGVDLKELAKKSDLKNLVEKKDLGVETESVNLKELAKKNDLDDLTKEVKGIKDETGKIKDIKTETGEIKTTADGIKTETDKISGIKTETDKIDSIKTETGKIKGLAKKNDLDDLNQQVMHFAQQDKAFDQAITKEIKTISQGVNVIPQEVKVEFARGNEVAGRYEAEIKLEGNKIGTFSSVGHYFFDNRIYIYDHFNPQVSIDLPPQYHFLKVVKTEEDGYKLAFCNEGGQEYYKIPSDYKLMSPENLKSIKNIDFEKYYAKNGSSPSFVVKMNSASYPNSSQHGVDVHEIGNGGKKIGSLIDEFGYYDSQNKFHYFNNHINAQDHSYDSPAFTINRGDIECSSHEMQVKARDIDLASDTAACSLVEYVANYVNDVYF